jgi:hypothetical protein
MMIASTPGVYPGQRREVHFQLRTEVGPKQVLSGGGAPLTTGYCLTFLRNDLNAGTRQKPVLTHIG